MNVKDMIRSVPLVNLTTESWEYYRTVENAEITPDFYNAIENLIHNIGEIEPQETGNTIAAKYYDENGLDVFAVDESGQDFSLMFLHWKEVLGYIVPDELAEKIGKSRLAAAILYEMTWLGSSNEENEDAIEKGIDEFEFDK